jgi:hypothetical protein
VRDGVEADLVVSAWALLEQSRDSVICCRCQLDGVVARFALLKCFDEIVCGCLGEFRCVFWSDFEDMHQVIEVVWRQVVGGGDAVLWQRSGCRCKR